MPCRRGSCCIWVRALSNKEFEQLADYAMQAGQYRTAVLIAKAAIDRDLVLCAALLSGARYGAGWAGGQPGAGPVDRAAGE